jgi:hypothetical protein
VAMLSKLTLLLLVGFTGDGVCLFCSLNVKCLIIVCFCVGSGYFYKLGDFFYFTAL